MKGRGTRLLLAFTALVVTMFVIAACGGGEPQGSERAAPSEPRQTQAESTPESVPRESAREEPPQDESVKEGAPAEDKAAKSKQESAQGGEESSSLSVTTIEGEEVRLGGQGDVMALYFMAGW